MANWALAKRALANWTQFARAPGKMRPMVADFLVFLFTTSLIFGQKISLTPSLCWGYDIQDFGGDLSSWSSWMATGWQIEKLNNKSCVFSFEATAVDDAPNLRRQT